MKILIDGLPPQFSSDILTDLLGPCGNVVSAEIVKDANGISSGLGVVVMSEVEEADRVCRALQGKDFEGLPLMVLKAP